jgi:hypothetical protein
MSGVGSFGTLSASGGKSFVAFEGFFGGMMTPGGDEELN